MQREDFLFTQDIIRTLWRRKWLMIACCGFGVLLGCMYLLLAPETYTANASLKIEQAGSPLQPQQDFRQNDQLIGTQLEIIKSRPVIESALKIYQPLGLNSDDPVKSIRKSLRTSPVEGTNIVKLAFSGASDDDAEKGLGAVIESYLQHQRQLQKNSYLEMLQFLTKRESELRTELESKERAYQLVREQSPVIRMGDEIARTDHDLLIELGKQLAQVRSQRIEFEIKKLAWFPEPNHDELIQSADTSNGQKETTTQLLKPALSEDSYVSLLSLKPVADLLDQQETNALKDELFRSKSREQELVAKFGARHSDVIAVKAQVADAEQRLESIISKLPILLSRELTVLKEQEDALTQEYQNRVQEIKDAEIHNIREQQAAAQVERSMTLYVTAVNQMREWQVDEDSQNRQGLQVNEVEPPHNSGDPAWPQKKLVLMLAALLGLAGGLGAVGIVESLDRRFWTVSQVARWSGLQVLGRIPHDGQQTKATSYRCLSDHPDSQVADAYRTTRAVISQHAKDSSERLIQFTSQQIGVGTTTIVSNLAIAFANAGKRVLLIDGDLRNGKLQALFAITDFPNGLTSYLKGDIELEAAIAKTEIGNLDVLGTGPKVNDVGDLITSEKVSTLKSLLGNRYDIMLCDSLPLLDSPVAQVFAGQADDVILTARIGRSEASDFRAERDLLQLLGAELSGMIVNGVTRNA
jgi:capsular exopolysaccharide synthesis family protein